MTHSLLPRRRVIAASMAGAAVLGIPAILRAAALMATPAQTEGPFYPVSFPVDSDSDLVHVAGHHDAAKGTVTRVSGRVLDLAGRPVTGARVEIWQCDAHGRYHNVHDDGGQPRDDNFQGFGQTTTDAEGGYRFLTIRPVAYTGRTPHIHFAVIAPGRRRFVTQMYVAGEPQNERDPVLRDIRDPAARARVVVPLQPATEIAQNALAADFDIVLA
ncbi:MAG: intradiol ring-cleavage dioxygenase [Alphaproteobacteria bacterium]|nr:intradiol ring-cleavage dioxygenase [Alphaproteobacteria bacterium]